MVRLGLGVDFGREPAARAAERLTLLPPLWMARPSHQRQGMMAVPGLIS